MTTTKARNAPRSGLDVLASLRSQLAGADDTYVTIDAGESVLSPPVWERKALLRTMRQLMDASKGETVRVCVEETIRTIPEVARIDYPAGKRTPVLVIESPETTRLVLALVIHVGPTRIVLHSEAAPHADRYLTVPTLTTTSEIEPMKPAKPTKPKITVNPCLSPAGRKALAVDTSPALATPPAAPPSAVVVRETLREALASAMPPKPAPEAPKPAAGYYTTRSEYRGAPMLCVHDAKGEIVLQFQARKAKALAACASEIAAFASEV